MAKKVWTAAARAAFARKMAKYRKRPRRKNSKDERAKMYRDIAARNRAARVIPARDRAAAKALHAYAKRARRKNPPRTHHAPDYRDRHYARILGAGKFVVRAQLRSGAGRVLHWNGAAFTASGPAALYPTLQSAATTARSLLTNAAQSLRKYQVWCDRQGSHATP